MVLIKAKELDDDKVPKWYRVPHEETQEHQQALVKAALTENPR